MIALANRYDLIFVADVTRKGDAGLRLAQEIQICWEMGLTIGVLHLDHGTRSSAPSPDIEKCRHDGLFDVIPAKSALTTRLVIMHSPAGLKKPATEAANIRAEKVVLVHDRRPDPKQIGLWLSLHLGPTVWAPTNRWIRAALLDLEMPVPILDEDWRPVGRAVHGVRPQVARSETVYGRVSVPGASQWPTTAEKLAKIYPLRTGFGFRVIGAPPAALMKELPARAQLDVIKEGDVSVERLIEMLDVFFYFPSAITPLMPEAAIATAMASGKLVVLPPHLKPHFGPGALYAPPDEALAATEELLADEDALAQHLKDAKRSAGFHFSEEVFREKVNELLGGPARKRPHRVATGKARKKKVLFVPSNGVGLGHVTRLLAISRRLDDVAEPVFVSLSQAASIIEGFGYTAEYLPSAAELNVHPNRWDEWFRFDLTRAIERHAPDAIVFDGNNPTPGLIHAALARSVRLVWVRRGMMGPSPSPHLDNARFMDLIIEPGEVAGEWDTGPTAARSDEALQTAPITLLDRREVLNRALARKHLGLQPDGQAVLIHLGAGQNRDAVNLIGDIIGHLQDVKGLELVIAEWANSPVDMPQWPGTKRLTGYPLCRYFNAFDFSISAAGYNSYHEVLAFGLPTIFIANRHPALDDQGARAEYAQHHSAGFDLSEDELFQLPALCEAIRTDAVRNYMREQGLQLSQGNGAEQAAKAISELIEGP